MCAQHTHADGSVHADHDEEKASSNAKQGHSDFTTETSTDKYELLLRFEQIKPGVETHLTLFISDFNTNAPINDAQLQLAIQEDATIPLEVEKTNDGEWSIHATFPEKKTYSMVVNLNSAMGPDLILLNNIEVDKELSSAKEVTEHKWYTNQWLLIILAFIAGMVLILVLQKLGKAGRSAIGLFVLFALLPLQPTKLLAHEGHDAGNTKPSGPDVEVPKETQFLFDMITQKISFGGAINTHSFFGTVLPSSQGQALASAPMPGKIISITTSVGSRVKKGQTLAIMEGAVDAASAMTLQSEKNNLQAELEVAKKELDRLKSISDIVSKKELEQATAHYQKTKDNLELLKNQSATRIEIKSPIEGVVDNFTWSIGANAAAGETLFTIINPAIVYVDAQIFENANALVSAANKFEISTSEGQTVAASLLAIPQTLHPSNQSQHVLFEINNASGILKIGEYVTVRLQIPSDNNAIVIPTAAITEIDGKSAVFIKNAAEHYSLAYVNTANENGTTITITKGLEQDQRVVINATYQMKMIYLNQ
jgi:RND family efflux transporter MFP subunit